MADREPFDLSAEKREALAVLVKAGARAWRFTFVPSPALAERGVNVNTVRQRLQAIGELINAAPSILPNGQIRFVFFVASKTDEATFAAWQGDQLTYSPYDPSPSGALRGPVSSRVCP